MNPTAAPTSRTLAVAALTLAAAGVSAQPMVTARVLSAQPIWEQVPVSDCAPGGYGGRPSGAGAGVGAVMGGLIGSQMGSGSGHIAGAILGALGGAMLGNAAEATQRGGYHGGYPGGCGTSYQNQVTGYDVSYEVGGRSYRTRTAQDPGPWLQVPAAGLPIDPYYGQSPYGGTSGVQSYPVTPPPMAGAYPLPAYPAAGESSGVVTAPPVVYGGMYPPAYPAAPYPQPVYRRPYPPPVYPAAPVYVRPAPAYVAPAGVNLSIGGGHGHRGRVGWSVGVGTGF